MHTRWTKKCEPLPNYLKPADVIRFNRKIKVSKTKILPVGIKDSARDLLFDVNTWDAVTLVNLNISMVRCLRCHLVCTIVYMNKNDGC